MPTQCDPTTSFTATLFEVATDPTKSHEVYANYREFAHEFRNRLNSLKLGLYLARRGAAGQRLDDWRDIDRNYRAIERFFEEFHSVFRPSRLAPIRIDIGLFLKEKVAVWQPWFEERGKPLALVVPDALPDGVFDPGALGQALDSLARWRADDGAPGAACRVIGWVSDQSVHLVWDETTASGSLPHKPGPTVPSSLALPLLARVVTDHGGHVQQTTDPGWRLRLRWPIVVAAGEPGPHTPPSILPNLGAVASPTFP